MIDFPELNVLAWQRWVENMGKNIILLALSIGLSCPISTMANTIILSMTSPLSISFGTRDEVNSTSWSQSGAYDDVSISVLVDSFITGETPSAYAYLTTRVGPGTTVSDEIARTQFTVPAFLPICTPFVCAAPVVLFSGLSLGPGSYFLTMGPDPASIGTAAWFSLRNPTVVKDDGVVNGPSLYVNGNSSGTGVIDPYSPASTFTSINTVLNIVVTGTPVSAVPEPSTFALLGVALAGMGYCKRRSLV